MSAAAPGGDGAAVPGDADAARAQLHREIVLRKLLQAKLAPSQRSERLPSPKQGENSFSGEEREVGQAGGTASKPLGERRGAVPLMDQWAGRASWRPLLEAEELEEEGSRMNHSLSPSSSDSEEDEAAAGAGPVAPPAMLSAQVTTLSGKTPCIQPATMRTTRKDPRNSKLHIRNWRKPRLKDSVSIAGGPVAPQAMLSAQVIHPGGNPGANLKSISTNATLWR